MRTLWLRCPLSWSPATISARPLTGHIAYDDALGRPIASDDPLGTGNCTNGSGCLLPGATIHHATCTTYSAVVASSVAGLPSGDGEPYLQTLAIDANLHQHASYTDALGRVVYLQRFSGRSQTALGGGISPYSVTTQRYDGAGSLAQVQDPHGHLTSFTYDKLGHQIGLVDPDRGSESYSYDANGNVTAVVDARGASGGTTYAGYGGLDRQVWRNTSNSASGAYVTYSYDSTAGGNVGVGRRTGETFRQTGGTSLGAGSYAYTYDARGRPTSTILSLNGTSYPVASSYTDFAALASQTYPTGETLATRYSASGAPLSLTRTASGANGTTTTLWDDPAYSSSSNTAGLLMSAHLGQLASISTGYDGDLRPSGSQLTRLADGATLFAEGVGYDNTGNVATTTTILPSGSVTDDYCYDEQDRLSQAIAAVGTAANKKKAATMVALVQQAITNLGNGATPEAAAKDAEMRAASTTKLSRKGTPQDRCRKAYRPGMTWKNLMVAAQVSESTAKRYVKQFAREASA